MKTKATFYHAGCTVCLAAEQNIVPTIDRDRYDVEIVKVYAKKRPGWEEGLQLVTNSLSGNADEVGGGS